MKAFWALFGLSVYTVIPKKISFFMSISFFVILIIAYFSVSYVRHQENSYDKIVPSITQLIGGVQAAISEDRNGDRPIVIDTIASMKRFFVGVIVGSTLGILFGLNMGLFPIAESFFLKFILYAGKIPPLAILPLIFIFSGLGESTKIILIVVGIMPAITLDVYFRTKALPKEQLVKALTLAASLPEVVNNIVLPQIMPSALNAVRINLINAWLFLIASEAISASAGLGYRIFLVRRYLAMDTIIPYVMWIALLAFLIDASIAWFIRYKYPWYEK